MDFRTNLSKSGKLVSEFAILEFILYVIKLKIVYLFSPKSYSVIVSEHLKSHRLLRKLLVYIKNISYITPGLLPQTLYVTTSNGRNKEIREDQNG